MDRQEAIYSLLHLLEEAPYQEVMSFFVSGAPMTESQAQAYWEVLLEYRREMSQTYGDRVSLNIAIYHLTRDPERLERVQLNDHWTCSKIAQTLAIQELKAWWERCSDTGLLLKEVMDQQLDRLVYHGLKKNAPVSLALVELCSPKENITPKFRAEVARFLMNACRCRDIVGHYENNRFSLIFPQTPRAGARVAVLRLQEFFHRDFPKTNTHLAVALAASPENGTQGKDLLLLAGDTLSANQRLIEKGKATAQDSILDCEGESPPLYRWWIYHMKGPTIKTLRSPKRLAALALLIILTIFSLPYLKFGSIATWTPILEKNWEVRADLHRWRWGRGDSDAFTLQKQDGFVVGGGQLLLEAAEEVWFRSSFIGENSLKLQLDVEVHPASIFILQLRDPGQRAEFQLHVSHNSLKWEVEGITLIHQTLISPGDHRFSIDLEFSPNRSSLVVNGEALLKKGPPYHRQTPWPKQCYVSAERGWVLLGNLNFQAKNIMLDEANLFDGIPLATRMLEIGRDASLDDWFDLMDDQGNELNETLLHNVLEKVKSHYLKAPKTTLELILKRGRRLSMERLWPELLKGVPASSLRSLFSEGELFRHRALGIIHEAQNELLGPVYSLENSLRSGSWGNSLNDILSTISVVDWADSQDAVRGWVTSHRWELARSDDIDVSFYALLDLLRGPTPSEPNLRKELLNRSLNFSDHNPLAIYQGMSQHLDRFSLAERNNWIKGMTKKDPMELLLKIRYGQNQEQQRLDYLRLERWMQSTDFGKILRYEWMWLGLELNIIKGSNMDGHINSLISQSRRDDLARQALTFQEKLPKVNQ